MIHQHDTERELKAQADADRRLLQQMRYAEEESFHACPEWRPTTRWDDSLEQALDRQIAHNAGRIEANRAGLGVSTAWE